jgi:TRAP-type C4-dicarboxylate transport system permease small subunit
VRAIRRIGEPKVLALVVVAAVAFALSFLISGSPEHTVHLRHTDVQTSATHPIDVILFVMRVGGGLALIIGIVALIGYRRGEMDLPAEALPAEAHTMDDGLPAAPAPSMSNVIGRL